MTDDDHPRPTSRLRFGLWRREDLEVACKLWGDPRVTHLIDARRRLSRAEVVARLRGEIELQRLHGIQYWPVRRRDDDSFVGCCGLHPREDEERIAEIGVHLLPEAQHLGYAMEACRAVIDHAFGSHGFDALFAGHHPRNEPSRRLLARLGFEYTHDERYGPTGLDHPSYRLARDPSLRAAAGTPSPGPRRLVEEDGRRSP